MERHKHMHAHTQLHTTPNCSSASWIVLCRVFSMRKRHGAHTLEKDLHEYSRVVSHSSNVLGKKHGSMNKQP